MSDFNRDRWGRPTIIQADGSLKPYTRISSYGQNLENQTGLTKWKLRTMVAGAVARPDLMQLASAHQADDRKLDDLAQQMLDAGGASRAANSGTARHEVLAQVDQGVLARDSVPGDFLPYMQAWYDTLDQFGLEVIPEMVELRLVNDRYEAAGSGDNFLMRTSDGKLIAVDKKTGKSIAPRPLAYMVQLALYATAVEYDVATGERKALPNVDLDVAYIAHLPAQSDTCTLYEIDLREALKLADLSQAIRVAEKSTPKVTKLVPQAAASPSPASDPNVERRALLKSRVGALVEAGHMNTLVAFWPDEVPTFKQSNDQTSAELDKITKIVESAEALHSMPFLPEPQPVQQKPKETKRSTKKNVDEGHLMDNADIDALRSTIKSLPTAKRKILEAWAKEASESGQSISLTATPSVRRFEIARVMIKLADESNPLELVISVGGTGATVGQALSLLTVDQAIKLYQQLNK